MSSLNLPLCAAAARAAADPGGAAEFLLALEPPGGATDRTRVRATLMMMRVVRTWMAIWDVENDEDDDGVR